MPVKVLVLVKHVPDSASEQGFRADGTLERGVDSRLSELDEYAVEQALRLGEGGVDVEITYLTMGPEGASDALRKALQMGGDRGVHVCDDALHGTDVSGTSLVLAAAARKAGFDLLLCGMASTDGSMGVLPAMLAERLGVAQATLAGEVLEADEAGIRVRRDGDLVSATVTAALPAVVSVTDQTGEARYPSFKGIMAAKKKPVETWSLADLGVDPAQVGLAGALTAVDAVRPRPPRTAGTVVPDEGEGGRRIAEFLAAQKLV